MAKVLKDDEAKEVIGRRSKDGRPSLYPRPLGNNERVKLQNMKKKADIKNIPLEEMEKYNVFAPELEARAFVDALVEAKGELVIAMRKCYPTLKQQRVEYVLKKGLEVVKALRVQELIKQALDKQSVNVDMIVSGILDISKTAKRDSDKLKALELLGKFRSMFDTEPKTVKNTVEYNLNISEDAARRLLGRRERFEIGDGGQFETVTVPGEDSSVVNGEEVVDGLHDTDAGELHT